MYLGTLDARLKAVEQLAFRARGSSEATTGTDVQDATAGTRPMQRPPHSVGERDWLAKSRMCVASEELKPTLPPIQVGPAVMLSMPSEQKWPLTRHDFGDALPVRSRRSLQSRVPHLWYSGHELLDPPHYGCGASWRTSSLGFQLEDVRCLVRAVPRAKQVGRA